MTKEEILQEFSDINQMYNNCMKYDTLKRMLDELTESNKLDKNIEALDLTIKILSTDPCGKCEVGNPCLYCKHEFEPQESEDNE